MSETYTTSTLVTLTAVLLSILVIGTTSASSKVFSNSGNNIITNQNCTVITSCDLSSSNVINREPTSTTPSPSPTCPDTLTIFSFFNVAVSHSGSSLLSGQLVCEGSAGAIPGATITFTGTGVPSGVVAITDDHGNFRDVPFNTPTTPGNYTAQAHFAGTAGLQPSNSQIMQFIV